MKPTQRMSDRRRHGDITDLDFYRRRAAELRVQALRDSAALKFFCAGLLLIAAVPIAFAAAASLVHGLHGHTAAAQTSGVLTR